MTPYKKKGHEFVIDTHDVLDPCALLISGFCISKTLPTFCASPLKEYFQAVF